MTTACVYLDIQGAEPATYYGGESFYTEDDRIIVLAELIAEVRLTESTREWPGACEDHDILYITRNSANFATLQRAGEIYWQEKHDA